MTVPIRTLPEGTFVRMNRWECRCVGKYVGEGTGRERGYHWVRMFFVHPDCYVHEIEFPLGTARWALGGEEVEVLPADCIKRLSLNLFAPSTEKYSTRGQTGCYLFLWQEDGLWWAHLAGVQRFFEEEQWKHGWEYATFGPCGTEGEAREQAVSAYRQDERWQHQHDCDLAKR